MPVVVVIDINGVLGDVRKKKVPDRSVDAMLPSGQYFYLNPRARSFLERLEGYPLVLWTSRLKKNARPIEQLPQIRDTGFITMLHGEDCIRRGWHPIKQVWRLREKLPAEFRDSTILFVDDSPEYIETDQDSRVLCCESYSAQEGNDSNLEQIVSQINGRKDVVRL